MTEKKAEQLAEEIVREFTTGGAIVREGWYGLSDSVAIEVVKNILLGEETHLEEHDILEWLEYEVGEGMNYPYFHLASDERIDFWGKALEEKNYWNIYSMFSPEKIEEITRYCEESKRRRRDMASYEGRRKEASRHISKPAVRKRILEKCNHRCVKCGGRMFLGVDHIVSIKDGGGNEDENLQILCSSCNSSKGADSWEV